MKFRPLAERAPLKELIQERIQNRTPNNGLFVQNDNGKAVIRIYDVVGWPFIEAQDVAARLDEIEADEIEVQINSPGGDAFEGVAIYNALRSHPARITTRVDGLAASAASIIAQAGDHRIMLSGSQMMIHDAWGLAIGNSDVMRDTGEILDKISASIAGIYEERSDREGMRDLMLAETWFTHDEAVESGLADEVVKPTRQNRAQYDSFHSRLEAAVAGVEKVAEEIETVSESRSSQGKQPLDDEAEPLVARLRDVLSAVAGVPGETENPEPVAEPTARAAAPRHLELDQIEAESVALQV